MTDTIKKIWVIGCTHFGHEGALRWTLQNEEKIRSFSSVEAMDERMISEWNDAVSDNDIVYHLGDVCFYKKKQDGFDTLRQLKGEKRLVLGNHDAEWLYFYNKYKGPEIFQEICGPPLPDLGVILSHRPLHRSQLNYGNTTLMNVHAHIHEKKVSDPLYFNACVERIGYRPKLLSDITSEKAEV